MKRKNIFGICAFAAFILVMTDLSLSGITVRTWLVYLVTAAGGLLWIRQWKKTSPQDRKKRAWVETDWLLGICLIWNILQTAADCIKQTGFNERNILNIALIMLFFLATMADFSLIYLDVSLICAIVVFAGALWHFMADASYTFNIKPLINDEQALTSFLLLINMTATGRYCRTADKVKQKIYFIIALIGYFLLFINRNVIGIVLMGICFMVFLLAYEPHREFVKRVMQTAFAYFFLLGNMSLIVNYTALIRVDCPYSLENSVYLELIMALAGVFFFTYWDKLKNDEYRPLYEFQKIIKWVLAAVSIVLLLLLVMGNRLDGMDGAKGISVLQQLSAELRQYAAGHNGTFYDVLERHGTAGGVWLVCTALAAVKKMREKRTDPLLTVIFTMYLLQSVFFSQQPVTAPIYTMLMAAALYGSGERLKSVAVPEGIKKNSVRKDEITKDGIKKDEITKDGIKKDEIKKDDMRKEKIKKDSKNGNMKKEI